MKYPMLLASASLAVASHLPFKTFPERQASSCNDSATSAWNVDFAVYCNTNQPGWDLYQASDPTQINTSPGQDINDCINQCSTQWGPCRGAVFDSETNVCWFKNATFEYIQSSSESSNTSTLAVPKASEVEGLPTDCPFDNNSVQQSSQKQNFTIHCDEDIIGADYTPQGLTEGLGYPFHTNSLATCMELCSEASPNCQGAAWNPDLDEGYANCYLKYNDGNPFSPITRNGSFDGNSAVIHSAYAQFPAINVQCNSTGTVQATSSNQTQYLTTCNQNMPSNDISQFHTTSLQSCVTACDELTTAKCIGVIFDTNYTSGWNNCWLKSATGTPQENDNGYIWATPDSASTTTSTHHSSSAWIAGPVAGGVVALAIIGAIAWYLLRKRKNRRNAKKTTGGSSYTPLEQTHETHLNDDYKQNPNGQYRWPFQSPDGTNTNTPYATSWYGDATQHPVELSPQTERQQNVRAELSPQTERQAPAELSSSAVKPAELGGGGSLGVSELPSSVSPTDQRRVAQLP